METLEYPELGMEYPIRHYTEFLAERLEEITPLLKEEIKALVTFHDPCYLGRVNQIYEEPRMLLKAIPGLEIIEMTHNRSNSLCCGGGGGGMWLDGYSWDIAETRSSEWRIQEVVPAKPVRDFLTVLETNYKSSKKNGNGTPEPELSGQHILAIACPYEKPRFEDAKKVVPGANDLVVKDIAELLAASMGI